MSLMDEANSIRDRIRERLRELEPLVEEYRELQLAAERMGLDASSTGEPSRDASPTSTGADPARREPPKAPTATVPRQPNRARTSSRSRRPRTSDLGARVLDAVGREPGGTVADYAERLGVTAAVLYRPVRDLTSDGRLVKRGRALIIP